MEGHEKMINHAYGLREVYIRYVSEYTNDAASDQFSDQANEDWRNLISVSQPRTDRCFAMGRRIKAKYRPIFRLYNFASRWK